MRASRLVIPLALAITFLPPLLGVREPVDARSCSSTCRSRSSAASAGSRSRGMTAVRVGRRRLHRAPRPAVLNGVLVLTSIHARRAAGEPLCESVVRAPETACARFLMTGLLASLGLLRRHSPTRIGSETQRPLAGRCRVRDASRPSRSRSSSCRRRVRDDCSPSRAPRRAARRRRSRARAGLSGPLGVRRSSARAGPKGPLWYALPPRRWTSSRSSSAPPAHRPRQVDARQALTGIDPTA
jgi:hypothetical protein